MNCVPHGQKYQPPAAGVSSAGCWQRPDLYHNLQKQGALPPEKQQIYIYTNNNMRHTLTHLCKEGNVSSSIWHADSHLREPEVKVLDACVEVLLLVGLFEFLALLCRFVDKELPLFIQSTEARLRQTSQTNFNDSLFPPVQILSKSGTSCDGRMQKKLVMHLLLLTWTIAIHYCSAAPTNP